MEAGPWPPRLSNKVGHTWIIITKHQGTLRMHARAMRKLTYTHGKESLSPWPRSPPEAQGNVEALSLSPGLDRDIFVWSGMSRTQHWDPSKTWDHFSAYTPAYEMVSHCIKETGGSVLKIELSLWHIALESGTHTVSELLILWHC